VNRNFIQEYYLCLQSDTLFDTLFNDAILLSEITLYRQRLVRRLI